MTKTSAPLIKKEAWRITAIQKDFFFAFLMVQEKYSRKATKETCTNTALLSVTIFPRIIKFVENMENAQR